MCAFMKNGKCKRLHFVNIAFDETLTLFRVSVDVDMDIQFCYNKKCMED